MMKRIDQFQNHKHRMHFEELVAQGEGMLTPKQYAFIYLIAMGQDEYIQYEGMAFYIENFEEVAIDGPVYLLDDNVDLTRYRHERLLGYAKYILQDKYIDMESVEETLRPWVEYAYKIIQNASI